MLPFVFHDECVHFKEKCCSVDFLCVLAETKPPMTFNFGVDSTRLLRTHRDGWMDVDGWMDNLHGRFQHVSFYQKCEREGLTNCHQNSSDNKNNSQKNMESSGAFILPRTSPRELEYPSRELIRRTSSQCTSSPDAYPWQVAHPPYAVRVSRPPKSIQVIRPVAVRLYSDPVARCSAIFPIRPSVAIRFSRSPSLMQVHVFRSPKSFEYRLDGISCVFRLCGLTPCEHLNSFPKQSKIVSMAVSSTPRSRVFFFSSVVLVPLEHSDPVALCRFDCIPTQTLGFNRFSCRSRGPLSCAKYPDQSPKFSRISAR